MKKFADTKKCACSGKADLWKPLIFLYGLLPAMNDNTAPGQTARDVFSEMKNKNTTNYQNTTKLANTTA